MKTPVGEYREQGRALVADEDDGERGLLTMLLHAHGYEAEGVASGEAALTLLEGHSFDLVLLDAELLGSRSELELLAAARQLAPDARFVMLAAFATVDMALAAMTHGACDYLRKPLHADELLRVITRTPAELRERAEQTARRASAAGATVAAPSVEARSTLQ